MALALLIMPSQWHFHLDYPGTTPMYLVLVGGELLIGACLGLGIMILMSGIQLAGDLISRAGGMTVSELFDPTFNSDVPMFSRLLLLVATAVFACMGGHRVVMAGLLDTFQAMPAGSSAATLLGTSSAAGGSSPFLQSLAETFVTLMSAELSAWGPRLRADCGRRLVGHANHRPDRPDAAAVEHLGHRFQFECPVDLFRDVHFAGRQPFGCFRNIFSRPWRR